MDILATTMCGRIIRGKSEADFAMLSDDPFRRVVMLFGDDGIERLQGLSPYEQLLTIGYYPDYIRELVAAGHSFRLVTFPQHAVQALPGTWDHILPIIRQIYGLDSLVYPAHIELCKHTPFEDFERVAGFSFKAVRKTGTADPRYMTVERFLECEPTALNLRLFLYFSLHLRELYSGDGYTKLDDGTRGIREYFAPNRRIENIPGVHVVTLDVGLL